MANEKWASDASYPAGSDAWSNTPTKVAPSVGQIAGGHIPDEQTAAQHENWWKNRTDTRLTAIETGQRWRPIDITTAKWIDDNVSPQRYWANGVPRFDNAGNDTLAIPLPVLSGERILEFRAFVSAWVAGAFTLKLFKREIAWDGSAWITTVSQLGATQTSAGTAGASELLSITGLTEVVPDVAPTALFTSYYAEIHQVSFSGSPSADGAMLLTDGVAP